MAYGPAEQGNKKKLTINQTINAHKGDVAFFSTLCNFGLRANGTSIRNHSPYQKKSFIFASHTIIHKIQAINGILLDIIVLLFKKDKALINHNHINK